MIQPKRWNDMVSGVVIVLITLIVYIPAMNAGFIWDDDSFLTDNPLIKANDGLYRFWFTTEAPDYFPLVSTSLWLEWRIWGMDATGYHVTNILLHTISAVLVWLVLKKLKVPGAWLAGLIFAVHPVNVESVAWITERKNTLPMVFYLLSVISFLQFMSHHQKGWYFLSLGTFLLALLGKTAVVMLPFVLLGCIWWQQSHITRRDLQWIVPFFFLSVIFGLITVWFQYNQIGEDVVRSDSFLSRLAGAGWAVWFYLYKAIIPYKLTFIYPRWQIDESSILSYIPLFVLFLSFAFFWRFRATWGRPLLFGLGYFVIMLLPVLGFLNIYFMRYSLVADHWQYFSIPGLAALIVGFGCYAAKSWKGTLQQLAMILAVCVVGILSVLTWKQGQIYKDKETLWLDTIDKNPAAWLAHNNLGTLYLDRGQLKKAAYQFQITLDLKPDYSLALYNLGLVYIKEGLIDEAVAKFKDAIKYQPEYVNAYNDLGAIYYDQGLFDKAAKEYEKALQISPKRTEVRENLAIAYLSLGKTEKAISEYMTIINMAPNHVNAHYNLGVLYQEKGLVNEAMEQYKAVLDIDSGKAEAHYNLGLAYFTKGLWDSAISSYERALAIDPNNEDILINLGNAYSRMGFTDKTLETYLKAVEINPENPLTHYNIGVIYQRKGLLKKAIAEFQEALRINPDFLEAKRNLMDITNR